MKQSLFVALITLILFSGCLTFERVPSIEEVLRAMEEVNEYQYEFHSANIGITESETFTQIMKGGMNLKRREGFEEIMTYNFDGELIEIYRAAVFDGRYYHYQLRKNKGEILENITEENPLEAIVSSENITTFIEDHFAWPLHTLSLFLKNGSVELIEKDGNLYVFRVEYSKERQGKYYEYIGNLTGIIWVNDALPVRFSLNITTITINLHSNITKRATSVVRGNITYSYLIPEWLLRIRKRSS
ncbi:hypothetical protein K1720_07890 [Thermococcus argininiproducens]|uniref:Uncharacterized protein n=1 Tax=Thermococcus argininiproducens TaxID=2866384 RepID=A0A9E7MA34_9EURY|nr:hypothetical protein [Thermococcus argininiproducens]USG99437.1 hypothetical protein K1720_07890 [Thermococcus argininiproducens]